MSFTIAIVGRPNVGKSTLFNRLVGKRLALVDDLPGVTRDRREGHGRLGDLEFTAIDTAGLESAAPSSLAGRMVEQTKAAIEQADAVIFLIDGRAGLVPDDRVFADLIRKSGKPAIVAANKSEGKAGEAGRLEAYELGLGDPLAISAEHGEGLSDLYDALREALPDATAEPATRRSGGRRSGAADSRRRDRAAQRRQVDADQPPDRAGAPAHRPRGRHHARHHRGRSRLAGPCLPPLRHRGHPPAAEGAGEAREAVGRRRAARHPLRRRGGAADGCREGVRGAGPAACVAGRARGPRAGDRHEQMGPGERRPARSPSCARRPTTGCRSSRACRWSASRA